MPKGKEVNYLETFPSSHVHCSMLYKSLDAEITCVHQQRSEIKKINMLHVCVCVCWVVQKHTPSFKNIKLIIYVYMRQDSGAQPSLRADRSLPLKEYSLMGDSDKQGNKQNKPVFKWGKPERKGNIIQSLNRKKFGVLEMAHWALVLPWRPEYEFPSTHIKRADMAVHIHDPRIGEQRYVHLESSPVNHPRFQFSDRPCLKAIK